MPIRAYPVNTTTTMPIDGLLYLSVERIPGCRFLPKTVWRPLANLPVADRRIDDPGCCFPLCLVGFPSDLTRLFRI